MMFWYGDGMHWWGYALMIFGTLVFWGGLVIAGTVMLARYFSRGGQPAGTPPEHRLMPEQVLAERYARGEIDDEEYHQRMRTLRGNGNDTNAATADPVAPVRT